MSEKEIKRLIGHLKEGGEIGRMPNSSVAIIIEALEKQVPQKWIKGRDDSEVEFIECPACGEVMFPPDNEWFFDYYPKHCINCGQAFKEG